MFWGRVSACTTLTVSNSVDCEQYTLDASVFCLVLLTHNTALHVSCRTRLFRVAIFSPLALSSSEGAGTANRFSVGGGDDGMN